MATTEDTRVTYDPIKLEQQKKYLDVLAVFHYVVAGLAALMMLLPVGYLFLGGVMAFAPEVFGGGGDPPPPIVGCFILAIGAFVLLLIGGYAAFTFYAGRCLARRRHFNLCLVSAAISCANAPLGTVLGVFTIIVLMQSGVREVLFDESAPATPVA